MSYSTRINVFAIIFLLSGAYFNVLIRFSRHLYPVYTTKHARRAGTKSTRRALAFVKPALSCKQGIIGRIIYGVKQTHLW